MLISNSGSLGAAEDDYHKNFQIPETDMTLYWSPKGIWVYAEKLKALYDSVDNIITTQINSRGRYAKLITDAQGKQRFHQNIRNGIAIEVMNIPPQEIQWSDLEDLMKGLRLEGWDYLCVDVLCEFAISEGHGDLFAFGRTYKER